MKISDLIELLENSKKHIGDVEVFIETKTHGENVMVPSDINGGRVDVLLSEELTDSEDFGRLFNSDETILRLG